MSLAKRVEYVELRLSEEEASVVKAGMLNLSWGDFPEAETVSDALSDVGIEAVDTEYDSDRGEFVRA